MSFGEFCNRALPLFKAAAYSVGGDDRLVDDDLRVGAVGKNKRSLAAHLVPARAADNGDASLDHSAIKVSHKMLSNGPRRDLKAAAGQGGAKRGTIAVKIFVGDGMLVNYAVIVVPAQEPSPAMTLW